MLGDSEIEGIANLPDEIFELNAGVSLRIWFDDGTNGKEQLGKDQPLLVAPYALSSLRPSSYQYLEQLVADLNDVSLLTGEPINELVERLSLVAKQTEDGGIIALAECFRMRLKMI